MNGLKDRVAIVTGAARGLGAEIARVLADEGAVLAIADLNLERARERASALERDAAR